jgi:hypothetical protein
MYLDYVRGDLVLDLGCLTLNESLEIHLLYDLHLLLYGESIIVFMYRFIISDYLIQADYMYSMTPRLRSCGHVNVAQIETTYNLLAVACQ